MKSEAFREIHRYNNPAPILVFQHTKERITSVDTHWHDDLEISLVSKGRIRFYVGGQEKDREEGRICITSSGEVHSAAPMFENQDDINTGITLLIQHDFLRSVIPNYDNLTFTGPQKEQEEKIAVYLAKIAELYEGQRDTSVGVQILGLVCQILSVLLEECAIERDSVDVNCWKESERQKIILDYIHLNYDQPLRQGELAEKFHFSKEYFCRFFKRYTGQTFKDLLQQQKLQQAVYLLSQTTLSADDIIDAVGYNNSSYFYRIFREKYGCSPKEYRMLSLPQ